MKNTTNILSKMYLIPEFSSELSPTFLGKVYAPHHYPCWCIKPSEISLDATIYDKLKQYETEYLNQGKQLWIISFDEKASDEVFNPFSFFLTDSKLERPTTEQLSRLENWYANINLAISCAKSEYLED